MKKAKESFVYQAAKEFLTNPLDKNPKSKKSIETLAILLQAMFDEGFVRGFFYHEKEPPKKVKP